MTTEEEATYCVVANEEDQYSIWPAGRKLPLGWEAQNYSGSKQDCLRHIERLWTDMRPRHLREAMDRRVEGNGTAAVLSSNKEERHDAATVKFLANGSHSLVVVSSRGSKTLQNQLATGCVRIKFTGTKGGTEIPVYLGKSAVQVAQQEIDGNSRTVTLRGELTVDWVKVKCVAKIDVESLSGEGHLEII